MAREFRIAGRPIEVRSAIEGTKIIRYAAVWDTYSENLGGFVEQVRRGTFSKTISTGNNIAGLGNHDPSWLLGTTGSGSLFLEEDDIGLRYELDCDESDPDGARMLAKVRSGKMPGSSFSFEVVPGGEEWSITESGFPLRTLTAVKLYDVGPVTFPAYSATERDFSPALRSLAAHSGKPFDRLVAAHAAGDVRSALVAEEQPEPPEPTTAPDLSLRRARLALAMRTFPGAGTHHTGPTNPGNS